MTHMRKSDLLRIILAAELSTRPQFRGYDGGHRHMQDIAHEWIHRREGHMMRASVEDAAVITNAVWYEIKPPIKSLLRPILHTSIKDEHMVAMMDRVFIDDLTIRRKTDFR